MIYKNGVLQGKEFNEGYTNFIKVGDVTVVNGIASNFSNTKYIKGPDIPKATASFKSTFGFILPSSWTSANPEQILGGIGDFTGWFLRWNSSSKLCIGISNGNGTNWQIDGVDTGYTLSFSSTYRGFITWDGAKYELYVGKDGAAPSLIYTYNSSVSYRPYTSTWGNSGSWSLGRPFTGSIILNECGVFNDENAYVIASNKSTISNYQVTANNFYEI